MGQLRLTGWTELQIAGAVHIAALFAAFNRLANAFGLASQGLLALYGNDCADALSDADIDADDLAFPRPLSWADTGSYSAQAVLDVHHSYNYNGRAPGDLLCVPVWIDLPVSDPPVLTLAQCVGLAAINCTLTALTIPSLPHLPLKCSQVFAATSANKPPRKST